MERIQKLLERAVSTSQGNFCVVLNDYYLLNMVWLLDNYLLIKVKRNLSIDYPEELKVKIVGFKLDGKEFTIEKKMLLEHTKYYSFVSYKSDSELQAQEVDNLLSVVYALIKSKVFEFQAYGT